MSGSPTYRPNLTGDPLTPSGAADHHQLVQPGDGGDPDRLDRSRSATRRATSSARTAFYQFDLGLHKKFGLGRDQTRLEARIEAFNVLNKTNFRSANGNRSSSAFGTITSTYPARQIQLGVKLYF